MGLKTQQQEYYYKALHEVPTILFQLIAHLSYAFIVCMNKYEHLLARNQLTIACPEETKFKPAVKC